MSDTTIENVRQRFDEIAAELKAGPTAAHNGWPADLARGASPMELIDRANSRLTGHSLPNHLQSPPAHGVASIASGPPVAPGRASAPTNDQAPNLPSAPALTLPLSVVRRPSGPIVRGRNGNDAEVIVRRHGLGLID